MSRYLNKKEAFVESKDVVVSYSAEGEPYSYYTSDKWFLWSLGFNVSFTMLSGSFKLDAKRIAYGAIFNKSLNSKKSTVTSIVLGASIFERCIVACGGDSFDFIDDDGNYRLFLNEAKKQKLKFKTWKNYLIFASHLYREGVINREIIHAEKLAEYLSVSGATSTQTLCLPESMAAKYYSEALNFVDKYHPYRYAISASYDEYIAEFARLSGKYSSTPTTNRYALRKITHIPEGLDIKFDYTGGWLSRLRGACYIVIAAFTGCRDGEIKSFTLNSYQEKKYAGMTISILNGIHTKPNVGGMERSTSWVTIPAVKKAIELLWHSFDFARDLWKIKASEIKQIDERNKMLEDANGLFITLPYVHTSTRARAGRQSLSHSLNRYVKTIEYSSTPKDVKEFNDLNPSRYGELQLGGKVMLNPHLFRRTFAVYLVRNKLASLLDLKYQFKHMNIAMTSWYANHANIASYFDMMADTELQDDIAGENQSYIIDTFYYLYNEAETLAGPEGRRIKNLRAEGNATVYLSREEIFEQVKGGQLSIVEHPSGYCTNPDCDRICDMTTCQYKVVTKDKAISLISIRDKLIVKCNEIVASGIDIPNVMSKIYFEIRSIEKILSEHNLEYKAFSQEGLRT